MLRSTLLFLAFALIVSLLPLRVQAALPKELPSAPMKFLTGASLTRSEDLWITAEAGGVYRLSGQEMKPKWEDMRKQPGFPKTDNCQSITKQQLETSPDQHPPPPGRLTLCASNRPSRFPADFLPGACRTGGED